MSRATHFVGTAGLPQTVCPSLKRRLTLDITARVTRIGQPLKSRASTCTTSATGATSSVEGEVERRRLAAREPIIGEVMVPTFRGNQNQGRVEGCSIADRSRGAAPAAGTASGFLLGGGPALLGRGPAALPPRS
jgi:hypothetical protein